MNDNKLFQNLPTHSPSSDVWNGIEKKLDQIQLDKTIQEAKKNLPVHSPDQSVWIAISARLARIRSVKRFKTYSAISLAAASIALLIIAFSWLNNNVSTINEPENIIVQTQPKPDIIDNNVGQEPIKSTEKSETILPIISPKQQNISHNIASTNNLVDETLSTDIATFLDLTIPENELLSDVLNIESELLSLASNAQTIDAPLFISKYDYTIPQLFEESTKHYYTFDGLEHTNAKSNNFALAVNYLPENVYNGISNSMFHNVGLTAGFEKEKVKFFANVGMSFNSEKYEMAVNYETYKPMLGHVTPGSEDPDTLGFRVTNHNSNMFINANYNYFTTSFGVGRKVFSVGNFSTWISSAAGFGLMTSQSDINKIGETSFKNMPYFRQINETEIEAPNYNNFYVDMLLGLDLNYKIIDKLSVTLTPVGRWFFKPIFIGKDNQPTDELTLGIKTGIRYNF
ncbi:MAG: hypothetical protein PHP31_04875 [Lentimicrobiaceae bacterium]|nr:hypothetical protein [Lentimicrobiaceae bacterium]